jgi:hypothetical protein
MSLYLSRRQGLEYRGFDIVEPLIVRNRGMFPDYSFQQLDITAEVPPRADLLFSKELFLHLTYEDILKGLANMKRSGSEWLVTSSHWGAENADLPINVGGSFRALDVCGSPIGLPEPIWRNKIFGLWRFEDIRI